MATVGAHDIFVATKEQSINQIIRKMARFRPSIFNFVSTGIDERVTNHVNNYYHLDPRVYYIAPDQHIHELAWYEAKWHHSDITNRAGGVSVVGSLLSSITLANGDPRVYHLAADQHIHELSWHNNRWNHRNVTTDAGGAPANSASLSVVTLFNGDPRVYYPGTDQHIHELGWYNGRWNHRDVTDSAGGPAVAGSSLSTTTIQNGDPRVYHLTAEGHVCELAWYGSRWHARDVTADAQGRPVAGHALSAIALGNGEARVYYFAHESGEILSSTHLHELASHGDRWEDSDLEPFTTQLLPLPPYPSPVIWRPDSESSLQAVNINGSPHVFFVAVGAPTLPFLNISRHRISELAWSNNAWRCLDWPGNMSVTPAPDTALRAVRQLGGEYRLYFSGDDHHIHELVERFHHLDITADTDGMQASGGDLGATMVGVSPVLAEPNVVSLRVELPWLAHPIDVDYWTEDGNIPHDEFAKCITERLGALPLPGAASVKVVDRKGRETVAIPALEFCLQITDLSIDLHPREHGSTLPAIPPQHFGVSAKLYAGLGLPDRTLQGSALRQKLIEKAQTHDAPTEVPWRLSLPFNELTSFSIDIDGTGHIEFAQDGTDQVYLTPLIDTLDVHNIQPNNLEDGISGYLLLIARMGILTNLRIALQELQVHYPQHTPLFSVKPTPIVRPGNHPARITSDLQAFYLFDEGAGNTVHDRAPAGNPLDLQMIELNGRSGASAFTWLPGGGLKVSGAGRIISNGPAKKITEAVRSTNELTMEAWIQPAISMQGGPARILTISQDTKHRNAMLAQGSARGEDAAEAYDVRLRTTGTDENGRPSLNSGPGTLSTELTHVAFTRARNGKTSLYRNGMLCETATAAGTCANWDVGYPLALANEVSEPAPEDGNRQWHGTYYLIAVYSRALSADEVRRHFEVAGPLYNPVIEDNQLKFFLTTEVTS